MKKNLILLSLFIAACSTTPEPIYEKDTPQMTEQEQTEACEEARLVDDTLVCPEVE